MAEPAPITADLELEPLKKRRRRCGPITEARRQQCRQAAAHARAVKAMLSQGREILSGWGWPYQGTRLLKARERRPINPPPPWGR